MLVDSMSIMLWHEHDDEVYSSKEYFEPEYRTSRYACGVQQSLFGWLSRLMSHGDTWLTGLKPD